VKSSHHWARGHTSWNEEPELELEEDCAHMSHRHSELGHRLRAPTILSHSAFAPASSASTAAVLPFAA